MQTNLVQIGNESYQLFSDDDYITNVCPNGAFEPEMVRLFSNLINKGDTVIDVGANIGCTAILFGQLAAKVKAFEASPTTFEILKTNIAKLANKNVEIYNLGLGNKEETLTLTFSPNNRSGGFISNQTQACEGHITETVNIVRGDDLLSDATKIDFIKIDTEGFELEVLRGLKNTINAQKPVCVVEMNHWCLNACQRISIPDFLDEIVSMFPLAYAFDQGSEGILNLHNKDERYITMYQHIVLGFKYQNIVCAFDQDKLAKFLGTYKRS